MGQSYPQHYNPTLGRDGCMAEVTIEIDDDLLDEAVRVESETDERGRFTLGTDYARHEVELLIVRSDRIRPKEAQSAD